VFHLVQGLATLAGSAVFGLYYDLVSPTGAFHLGAGIAAVAVVLVLRVEPGASKTITSPQ
jgi:hypothetical protein